MTVMNFLFVACLGLSQTNLNNTEPAHTLDLETEVMALTDARLYNDALLIIEKALADNPSSGLALRLLGDATQSGYGVDKSDEDAVALYRRAANLGDAKARFRLGQAYETGQGIAQSTGSALTQYELAATSDPHAALRYAEIALANQANSEFVPKHSPTELLEYANESGLTRAGFILGSLLVKGGLIEKNEQRAMSLFQRAATSEPEALSAMGTLLHQRKDFAGAVEYFKQAREKGDPTGSAYLGYYAEHGIARTTDRDIAISFYREAGDLDWAKKGIERVTAHKASIDLFGMPIYGTTRKEVVSLFKAKQAKVLAGQPHFDAFDVSKLVDGRQTILTVGYAPGGPEYAAEFNYAFRSTHKTIKDTVDELEQTLKKRYGKWTNKKRSGGNTAMYWTVDNVRITLTHERPSHTVNVTYQVHPYAQKLAEYSQRLTQSNEKGLEDAL